MYLKISANRIINALFLDKRRGGGRHICAKLFQLWQPLLFCGRLQWSLQELEVLHKDKLLFLKDLRLGKCLLPESTKAGLVLVKTVLVETKTRPELVAKTFNHYSQHNGSTKKKNDRETKGASVRAGRL